uniref:USP domain-containing protein n=1 Tax=Tetranychus urticae TaxID=32264 RepID=T1KT80_TETUR
MYDDLSAVDFENKFEYISYRFPREITRIRSEFKDDTCLKCSVIDDDDTVYEAFGCHYDIKRACDIACFRLGELLLKSVPSFVMPPYLIGFPNIRGHCFLIAAVLPIFYSFPIMSRLFRLNCDTVLEVNLGLGRRRPSKRPRIETPRMWVQSLYKCYKDFHKISIDGYYEMLNLGYIQKKVLPECRNDPDLPDHPVNPRKDILMDVVLIRGVCNMLGNYCDNDYLKPGGDECQAYGFIMSKLCYSNPELFGEFMFRFKTTSACGNCCGGPFSFEFAVPYINVPLATNFQALLRNPVLLGNSQKLSHAHYEPLYCPGKLRDIDFCEYLEHPDILCLRYEFGTVDEEINVPNTLWLTVKEESKKYKRLCSSVVIKCYTNEQGEAYPPFYRKPIAGDRFDIWHTYLQIRTQHGWYEVNNGEIFPVDTRLFKVATPGSLHFYQSAENSSFLPDLVREFVNYYPDR